MGLRQKNQQFGTLDLIMLVVLCGTVSTVVGASVAGLLHDDRPTRARQMAESLAFQLRQQHEVAQSKAEASGGGGRMPASVQDVPPLTDGQMGKDPWGKPYHYSVIGKIADLNATIVVWSEGPNGKLDTKIDELNDDNFKTFHFRGDDVGFISNTRYAIRDIRRNR